jgi:TonB family protein
MSDQQHKKHFLKMPKYPGGSKAFKEFITENLRYPDAALEARVVGSVLVEYDIHDTGAVSNAHVLKGIGYGCDEEAIRLVKLLQFEKVKNRGVRVKLTFKTAIHFRLPNVSNNFAVSYTMEQEKPVGAPEQKPGDQVVYSYTVQF